MILSLNTKTLDLTSNDAAAIAFHFLTNEWELAPEERDWFTVLSSRLVGESWYVVEVGIEGLPDKWVLQVYDTGECDPNYTFVSPIRGSSQDADLSDYPESIAEILTAERWT
ncbi:MAG: hypothetical protein VKK04_14525 [Synechococcales bacterium]|nr:hypothetical protein [Synechococcales bacterium]